MNPSSASLGVTVGLGLVLLASMAIAGEADPRTLVAQLHHLRAAGPREWSSFPDEPEAARLTRTFAAKPNNSEFTLVLHQHDVKQPWRVRLNEQDLGRLIIDENDMVIALAVPPQTFVDGENTLLVEPVGDKPTPDDIRVGRIRLVPNSRAAWLSQTSVRITVKDGDTGEPIPSRITVVDGDGALQSVGADSNESLAVRPGVIYTSTGVAEFGLPAGNYRVYAGRGFEYSLDATEVVARMGERLESELTIRRVVPTHGYVACDTHLHTLTFSGHGDATIEERMITLAGEGIELPIATDHNRHVDYEPIARKLGVRRYFTPVVGNEVTTSLGHFNVFPARLDAALPNHRAPSWVEIFQGVYRTPDVKVVILNHARDLHSGVRPFGPALHNAAAGANVAGWKLQANAMEVINSGATQSEPLQLLHDWMAALNHGHSLAPIGASDSHDVARHFVGQGRTYIRARDDDPAAINIDEAVRSLVEGRVMVSYGLLAELTVDGKYTSGDLATLPDDQVNVRLRVLGPGWTKVDQVRLYSSGELIAEEDARHTGLSPGTTTREDPNGRDARSTAEGDAASSGVLAEHSWQIPRPKRDVHLVAVAVGPAITNLYWPTAKPYQPTSPDFNPITFGCSGAVWLDGDGNGRKTPAIDYANEIISRHPGDLAGLLAALAEYDEATAIQAAHLWQTTQATSLLAPESANHIAQAPPKVREALGRYLAAWRENQMSTKK